MSSGYEYDVDRYTKVLILVTKEYKNVYLMDKDCNRC